MALNLGRRRLGNRQITDELGCAASAEAFGNVGHNRDASALNLIAQAEVLAKRPLRG